MYYFMCICVCDIIFCSMRLSALRSWTSVYLLAQKMFAGRPALVSPSQVGLLCDYTHPVAKC